VWYDALGESNKLIYCPVQPFVCIGPMYDLSVLETLHCNKVDDGVC
jgi:hypothetical protein